MSALAWTREQAGLWYAFPRLVWPESEHFGTPLYEAERTARSSWDLRQRGGLIGTWPTLRETQAAAKAHHATWGSP